MKVRRMKRHLSAILLLVVYFVFLGNKAYARGFNCFGNFPEAVYYNGQPVKEIYYNGNLVAYTHTHTGSETSGGGCYGLAGTRTVSRKCDGSLQYGGYIDICDRCGKWDATDPCNECGGGVHWYEIYWQCGHGHVIIVGSGPRAEYSSFSGSGCPEYITTQATYYSLNCGQKSGFITNW